MRLKNRVSRVGAAAGVGAVILAAAACFTGLAGGHPKLLVEPASAKGDEANAAKPQAEPLAADTVELSEKQVAANKCSPAGSTLIAASCCSQKTAACFPCRPICPN
jgi:hypothetical protein